MKKVEPTERRKLLKAVFFQHFPQTTIHPWFYCLFLDQKSKQRRQDSKKKNKKKIVTDHGKSEQTNKKKTQKLVFLPSFPFWLDCLAGW